MPNLTNYKRLVFSLCCICLTGSTFSQSSPNIKTINIEKNHDYGGFDLLDLADNQVFVLAEHWHNIRLVPQATLKLLKYLHRDANVRILAIEQGNSSAYLVNKYLNSGDTTVLRKVVRNTMFWGKENHAFFQDLYHFNQILPKEERIVVRSIDIEYKMESAILLINEVIGEKEIPGPLEETVGIFKQIFEDTRAHREQFDALSVMYYYDRNFVMTLVGSTLIDLENQPEVYQEFFGNSFDQFSTIIDDMRDGLFFDYVNPNTNYKFRDNRIFDRFKSLLEKNPDSGILCVIGMRHATKGSSVYKLKHERSSPVFNKVLNIRVSALFKNTFKTSDLRRINFSFPDQLKTNQATLIKHDKNDPALRSAKAFDYTLFINDNYELTPFPNALVEDY